MTLTLAPRSHSAFSKFWFSIEQSIVGHPGSFFLIGDVFRMAALNSSINLISSVVGSGLLLLRMSQRYFAYVGTYMTSSKGILIYNF
jgi:hypothetical protein